MAFGWDQLIPLLLGGANLALGLGQGGGQERATFEGETFGEGAAKTSIDPRDLLGQGVGNTSDVLQMIMEQIGGGVNMPGAYAQDLPTFSGGGLPMPIGVTGRDPAVKDPGTHLRKPGQTAKGQNIGPWAGGIGPEPGRWNPIGGLYGPPGGPENGQPFSGRPAGQNSPNSSGADRNPNDWRARGQNNSNYNADGSRRGDVDKALAAVDLLKPQGGK